MKILQKNFTNGILTTRIVKEFGRYKRLSEEEKQIDNFKRQFRDTVNANVRKEIFDTLATYGNKGISAINELLSDFDLQNPDVKRHGLEVIRKLKESS